RAEGVISTPPQTLAGMALRIRRLETGLILMSAIHAMPSTGHYPLDPPALFADMPYSQPMPPHRHARDASIQPAKDVNCSFPECPLGASGCFCWNEQCVRLEAGTRRLLRNSNGPRPRGVGGPELCCALAPSHSRHVPSPGRCFDA
ncbi:hypothetical protein COCCADRAFT_96273, partial [Bipolaris zeicola 26-R-13]